MTNLEMMDMQRGPQHAPTRAMERLGKIVFSQEGWEGADQSGIDFPALLGQLGFVPVDISKDIRSRMVSVFYRWYGFPALQSSLSDTLVEYRIQVGYRVVYDNGENVRDVCKLVFIPNNNAAVTEQIVAIRTETSWIVNPIAADLVGQEDTQPVPETTRPRHVVPARRIVVRS